MTETMQANRRPQHITIVSETFPPEINGVANTLRQLCQGLMQRGHRITVIRPRQQHEAEGKVAAAGQGLFTQEHVVTGLPLPGYADLRLGLVRSATLNARMPSTLPPRARWGSALYRRHGDWAYP